MNTAFELTIALALFLLLDAVIFRSGLYTRILAPESYAGQVQLVVSAERERPVSAEQQVLVLGDSRTAEGFSAKLADTAPDARFKFVNASVPGSTLRTEYYLLRELDADARRYAAIVIPLDDYDDLAPPGDLSDRELDLAFTSSLLRYEDVVDFPWTFERPQSRVDAALDTLLRSYAFRLDVQDLVADPVKRIRDVIAYRNAGVISKYEYPGRSGSVAGLRYDAATDSYVFPPGLGQEQRDQFTAELVNRRAPPLASTGYREYWLGRILARYQASQTSFVIVQTPRGPAPPPATHPASFQTADWLASHDRVQVMPRVAFEEFELPELFFDALHLNARGRQEFTQALSQVLESGSYSGSGRSAAPAGWTEAPTGGLSLDLAAAGAGASFASGIYPRDTGLNFVQPDFSFTPPVVPKGGRIQVHGYLPPPLESILPLTIRVDGAGQDTQTTALTSVGPFTLEIPIGASTPPERLMFHLDKSIVPREIGLNQDERPLSIGLVSVEFAPQSPGS